MDKNNNILTVDKDFFEFGYDKSILHDKNILVLSATFKLAEQEKEVIRAQAVENLNWRSDKHPPLSEFPSCGSVFKKIEGIGAGRLIEKVGLKGYQIGGAKIHEQHANFIVNTGNATAKDVLAVIKVVQEKVKAETGYELKPEISFVGEF